MKSGDVVVLHFPFTDLSGSRLRPAVILADVGRNDFVACQVTTNQDADLAAIRLTAASFSAGGLRQVSYARPAKLFTAHRSVMAKRVGRLTDPASDQIRDAVIEVIRRG